MKVKCYAVLDAKVADFQLAIFDIKDEGAIRQFADAINEKMNPRWAKHPEDYSLWCVGEFDSERGTIASLVPSNLVNGVAVLSLKPGPVPDVQMFPNGSEKEPVIN